MIQKEWMAATEPVDDDTPLRVSSLSDLKPVATEVPNTWLGGDHDRVYSAIALTAPPENGGRSVLIAGANRDAVLKKVNEYPHVHIPDGVMADD